MDQLIRQNSAMRTSMERQVVVHTGRVDELQRAVRELESERDEVAERARQSGDEISRLKAMVQELDRERDRVQEVADGKEEELAQLRESANAERKTRSGSDARCSCLRTSCRRSSRTSTPRNRWSATSRSGSPSVNRRCSSARKGSRCTSRSSRRASRTSTT